MICPVFILLELHLFYLLLVENILVYVYNIKMLDIHSVQHEKKNDKIY